jgi:hypothetical protein
MKSIATTGICLLLFASVAFSQIPEKKRSAHRARAAVRSLSRLVANGGAALLNGDFDKKVLSSGVSQWLEVHRDAIIGAGSNPFPALTKWGVATTNGDKLFLHVMRWPEDGKLLIPRLHNSVKSAHVFGQSSELKLKPNVSDWELTLNEKPKRSESILPIIEIELDAAAVVAAGIPPELKPSEDGLIHLHSRYAIVHGEMLRFEPQPHKNTVGYWVNETDWAEWSCIAAKSGRYEVELRYGCGIDQGGSDVEITVGDHVLPFKVEATGGFQAWKNVHLGTLELQADKPVRVTAKPKKKAKNAVMDIQQITLRLVK